MRVEQIMNPQVLACRPHDSLNQAAQLMWEHRCGGVPVVNETNYPVGFLTDRDICMAAYTKGTPIKEILVDQAMAHEVVTCKPDDKLISAAELMRQHGKRRLVVVNPMGRLAGLLSLDDLAHEAARALRGGVNQPLRDLVLEVVLATSHGHGLVRPAT